MLIEIFCVRMIVMAALFLYPMYKCELCNNAFHGRQGYETTMSPADATRQVVSGRLKIAHGYVELPNPDHDGHTVPIKQTEVHNCDNNDAGIGRLAGFSSSRQEESAE
jgi:hypothetical protein